MSIIKKSVKLYGHSTSISLESEFWDALKNIAQERHLSVSALIAEIDQNSLEQRHFPVSSSRNLSSTVRVYILTYFLKHD